LKSEKLKLQTCYSGKIYQINQNGLSEKIYFIPEDNFDRDGIKTGIITFKSTIGDLKLIIPVLPQAWHD